MKYLFALMLMTTAAHAECLQWGTQINTGTRVCMVDDAVNHNPVIPDPPQRALPMPGAATISAYTPKCEDGWTLVATPSPMCARELKAPK